MVYEIIEKINSMNYSKNTIKKIKNFLPNDWHIEQGEANELVEEVWVIYDDNNMPVIDVLIEEDTIEGTGLFIVAEPYTEI